MNDESDRYEAGCREESRSVHGVPSRGISTSSQESLIENAIRTARQKARDASPSKMDKLRGVGDPLEVTASLVQQALSGYEILERLDQGGQGVVYKAIETSTKRLVAIKVLKDGPLSSRGQRERFSREIAVIARMQHPNIISFYHSQSQASFQFFIMQYIDGIPIDDYVLLNRPSVRQVVELFTKICSAVHSAHQQAVIHRDLKPDNILVDLDGEPHILDFGLAKDIDAENGPCNRLSLTGQVVGTLPYLSPEQAGGDSAGVNTRSDVYSLGVILYQCLTGRMPYPIDGTSESIRNNILSTQPESIRKLINGTNVEERWTSGHIPNDLERIVLKALAKDETRRYQSAEAFADDLNRYLRGEAVQAKSDSYWYILRKMLYRHRLEFSLALASLLILFGATISIALLWQRNAEMARVSQAGILIGTYARLGDAARKEGQPEKAQAMLEKAVELGKKFISEELFFSTDNYDANALLAGLHYTKAEVDFARPYRDDAVKIAEEMHRAAPDDPKAIRQLSMAYCLQGAEQEALKNFDAAMDKLKVARKLQAGLVASQPDDVGLKSDLAWTINKAGLYAIKAKRYKDALPDLLQAHAMYVEAASRSGDSLVPAIDLVDSENSIAGAHIGLRTPQDRQIAKEWLDRAQEGLKKLNAHKLAVTRASNIHELQEAVQRNYAIIARQEAKWQASQKISQSQPSTPSPLTSP